MKIFFALLIGFVGLALFHSGEVSSQFQQMMGDRIDIRFCTYIVEHLYQAIQGKAEWLSPPMFYPSKGTLGYSDITLLHFLAYAPFRLFSENPFNAMQFSIIALNFLTFVATFLFLKRALLTSTIAATVGAYFFSFNSAKFNQLNHIQLQPLLLLPLMAWLLWLFLKNLTNQSSREIFIRLSVAGLLLNIQLLTSVYIAWYFSFWVLLVVLFWGTISKDNRKQLKTELLNKKAPVALAASTFAIGMIPFLVTYIPVVLETGTRSYGEVKSMIPRLQSLFWMDSTNYVWGWLANAFPSFYELPLHWEHRIGLGLAVTLGLPIALVYSWYLYLKANSKQKNTYIWAVVICSSIVTYYLLGMIYWSNRSPWWLVYKFIPGAASIRAVARYALVTALPISIGLSILVDLIWRKASKQTPAQRTGITALMTIVILFLLGEQSGRQLTFSKTTEFEKMKVLASRLGSDCDNFYITMRSTPPTYMAEVQGDALAVSMLTGKPTLNGYSGQSPKDWPLWDIGAKDYVINIGVWQQSKGISGKTCALSID